MMFWGISSKLIIKDVKSGMKAKSHQVGFLTGANIFMRQVLGGFISLQW